MSKKGFSIAPLVLIAALIIYAFSTGGFWAGVHLLGDILNIFGTIFVWVIGFIWNIPVVGQKVIKNCITTIIIAVVFGTSLSKSENKIASLVVGGIVSLVCLLLSWSNLI